MAIRSKIRWLVRSAEQRESPRANAYRMYCTPATVSYMYAEQYVMRDYVKLRVELLMAQVDVLLICTRVTAHEIRFYT